MHLTSDSRDGDQEERVVAFCGVGKTFAEGVEAVREINLSVTAGEFVTLVGPSGVESLRFSTWWQAFSADHRDRTVPWQSRDCDQSPRRIHDSGRSSATVADCGRQHLDSARDAGRTRSEIAREIERLLALVGLEGFHESYPRSSPWHAERVALPDCLRMTLRRCSWTSRSQPSMHSCD